MKAVELIVLLLLPAYVGAGYVGWRLHQSAKERRRQKRLQQMVEENRQLDEILKED